MNAAFGSDYLNVGKQARYHADFMANARVNFVRKVFGIVAVQLATTAFFIALSAFSTLYIRFQEATPFITGLAALTTLITMLILVFSRDLKKTYPKNYILLGVFTLCESYTISSITAFYEPIVVFESMLVTAGIVAALTLYAFTTKQEITYFMGLIWMFALGSLFVGIIGIFSRAQFIHLLYALIGTVMAGLYLIYDIKAIMGDHATFKVDIDDYVGGALNLYIDIVRIFLKVLEFLSKDDKDKKKK